MRNPDHVTRVRATAWGDCPSARTQRPGGAPEGSRGWSAAKPPET